MNCYKCSGWDEIKLYMHKILINTTARNLILEHTLIFSTRTVL